MLDARRDQRDIIAGAIGVDRAAVAGVGANEAGGIGGRPERDFGSAVPKPVIQLPSSSAIGSVVRPSEPTLIVALSPMTMPLGL